MVVNTLWVANEANRRERDRASLLDEITAARRSNQPA